MINVDFKGTGFPEDIRDGAIEVRYIPGNGLCICACWDSQWYYLPMIGTQSTDSYENKIEDLTSKTSKLKKEFKNSIKTHERRRNPHGARLADLKDLQMDDTYTLRDGTSIKYDLTENRFKIADLDNTVINKATPISKVVNTAAAWDYSLNSGQVFEINVTGSHANPNHTISSMGNARQYEHYTFINNSAVAGNEVRFTQGASIKCPKGVSLTLKQYDVVRFYALQTNVLLCLGHSDNTAL